METNSVTNVAWASGEYKSFNFSLIPATRVRIIHQVGFNEIINIAEVRVETGNSILYFNRIKD